MLKRFSSLDRTLRWLLPLTTAVLLAACASAPPPPSPPSAPTLAPVVTARTTALRSMGFEKTDEGYELNLPGPLLFETGSDVVSDGAKAMLAKLATDLIALDIHSLRLFGHTDDVGTAVFNRGLSAKRAEAVGLAMIGQGFETGNLERRGFGFDRPLTSNDTPEGRAKNRRVAVIVPFE